MCQRDRGWTSALHILARPCVCLKVQVTLSVSVLLLFVCSFYLHFLISCRMIRWIPLLLLLGLSVPSALGQEAEVPAPEQAAATDSQTDAEMEEWGMNSIRGSFEAVSGYFDSMLEFMGGRDGVCQYRCRHGKHLLRVMLKAQIHQQTDNCLKRTQPAN